MMVQLARMCCLPLDACAAATAACRQPGRGPDVPGVRTPPHLNLALHVQLLHDFPVAVGQARVVQPDPKLQRVPQRAVPDQRKVLFQLVICMGDDETQHQILPAALALARQGLGCSRAADCHAGFTKMLALAQATHGHHTRSVRLLSAGAEQPTGHAQEDARAVVGGSVGHDVERREASLAAGRHEDERLQATG